MRISINLLPPETIANELKRAKFYKIQVIGVTIVLVMVFLASLTVGLRILQSSHITGIQTTLASEEQKITDLKDTQGTLIVLKDRLKVIDQYLGVASSQSSMYKLIDKLIPPAVAVSGINIDKTGGVVFSVLTTDSSILDALVSSLTDKEANEGKITQVSVESLNRGRDGYFRVSFKIKSKS